MTSGLGPDEDRVRGLMLGLLIGDAYDELAGNGPIRGTCASHLSLFTLEGLVRACVRADHKGICRPTGVIWHAWCRWAHVQGLGPQFARRWGQHGGWPDGWLHQVAPLAVRRGSAPATVAALQHDAEIPDRARTPSAGYHAVTRSLPVAALASVLTDAEELARDVAALTHGGQSAQHAAGLAVRTVLGLMADDTEALSTSLDSGAEAPPGTAAHALLHGAHAHHSAGDLRTALLNAAPHGRGATTVAGALHGAARGISAVPQSWLSRLEVGWVADRLARDAVLEATVHPSGSAYADPTDPMWWSRYPGW